MNYRSPLFALAVTTVLIAGVASSDAFWKRDKADSSIRVTEKEGYRILFSLSSGQQLRNGKMFQELNYKLSVFDGEVKPLFGEAGWLEVQFQDAKDFVLGSAQIAYAEKRREFYGTIWVESKKARELVKARIKPLKNPPVVAAEQKAAAPISEEVPKPAKKKAKKKKSSKGFAPRLSATPAEEKWTPAPEAARKKKPIEAKVIKKEEPPAPKTNEDGTEPEVEEAISRGGETNNQVQATLAEAEEKPETVIPPSAEQLPELEPKPKEKPKEGVLLAS